jgi:hypothetical protein
VFAELRNVTNRVVIRTCAVPDQTDEEIMLGNPTRSLKRLVKHKEIRLDATMCVQLPVQPDDFTEDLHDLSPAAMRRDLDYLVVVAHDGSHAVANTQRPPSPDRCGFSRGNRFHTTPAAEKHGNPLVKHQQDGAVTLLREDTNVGLPHPRRDLPIHVSCVVTWKVSSNLLKVQSSSAQP